MSYKQEFQSNNADLQGLIDLANSLPEAENLDTELATQDALIAQIATALEGRIMPSFKAICFSIGEIYYPAEEGMTWLEWVESDYNTGGFTCYGDNYEVHATLTSVVKSVNINSGLLLGSSIIEPNGKYKIMTGGGDN